MRKPSPQPDFQALFFETFGSLAERRCYTLRFGTSHLFHDAVFLSSLLHDARFSTSAVKRRGDQIVISLTRDLWELGSLTDGDATTLCYRRARLSISGVTSLTWLFMESIPLPEQELWLDRLVLKSHFSKNGTALNFESLGWQLQLELAENRAGVVLQDIGPAYSHADGKAQTNRE